MKLDISVLEATAAMHAAASALRSRLSSRGEKQVGVSML